MFGGGDTSIPVFPVALEKNCFQCDANILPQLQLFGEFGSSIDPLKYITKEHRSDANHPIKRVREPEAISKLQKLQISLNNTFYQDEAAQTGSILTPNAISSGLRLSYEQEERNSSVTSADESMKAVPNIFSFSDNLKLEIDQQKEEFDHFFRIQEGNFAKGLRELKQRHMISYLNALEKGVRRKLHEKDLEVENLNRKSKELGDKIKRVAMEARSWQFRASYNESVVNVLKSQFRQVVAQHAVQAKEGCGDNKVDDAASYLDPNLQGFVSPDFSRKQLTCRACREKEVSVLLMRCRHLCICKDCEEFIEVCPICQAMKTASVLVYVP